MALAAMQVLAITTEPVEDFSEEVMQSSMRLQINPGDINYSIWDAAILPLTQKAGFNQTDEDREEIFFKGRFVITDTSNYNTITETGTIVYLSCQPNVNMSNIDPSTMLTELTDPARNIGAIVLYNTEGKGCSISQSTESLESRIYSMNDKSQAASALELTDKDEALATVSGDANITETTGSSGTDGRERGNNSAVAMSILYSITGLITLLFLVIIATGAIKAHRYPERYGPREGLGGQPRQSRAKGLARAVLDTLPIIKFGDNQQQQMPVKDPERDHELQSIPEDRELETNPPMNTPPTLQAASSQMTSEDVSNYALSQPPRAEPLVPSFVGSDHGDGLGCSICTEDFLVGEDVRVLPCDHKFHPQCVDPWLINVSGTCPLCRLDLRPPAAEDESPSPTADENNNLAPPLESDETSSIGAHTAAPSRRMSRFFDLNMLRHAPQEERILALRQYATENGEREESGRGVTPTNDEERSRRTKLADRLRDKFRIRTTRRAQFPDMTQASQGETSRTDT